MSERLLQITNNNEGQGWVVVEVNKESENVENVMFSDMGSPTDTILVISREEWAELCSFVDDRFTEIDEADDEQQE